MGAEILITLWLVQEIQAKLLPNKKSEFWEGEIHRAVGCLEVICGISILAQEWMTNPKAYLERLDKELEEIKEKGAPSWRARIQEVLSML
jgi:hypothetical protein